MSTNRLLFFNRHACDRRKPSCSRCYRRGISCVYPEAAPTLKKLQKATDNFGDRLKLFGERLKTGEIVPLQPLFYSRDVIEVISPNQVESPYSESILSSYSEDSDDDDDIMSENHRKPKKRSRKVASTNSFSVYPCIKCFKDLQQCDLTLPKCSRCEANNFDCAFKETEPKANHVSQVLTTMNKVMDQWQDSIDRVAKGLAQKTKSLSIKANNSLRAKPVQTSWKITTTKKGISVESNVKSYCDFSTLVDQFKRSITITQNRNCNSTNKDNVQQHQKLSMDKPILEFDENGSIHTTSGFAIWNLWAHPTHAMPQDYPIDISKELTDNLVELYCRTPCCSSIRLPIIDTVDFLKRYRNSDVTKRPPTVLVYAVCAMAARNAFQLHVWSKRPSFDAPQYNMGKALSVAYCLRGRELLSDCFDEPSLDNCQAAFLLSYCNYQNGYPGVIYFYEWIAYNMALQLGLYDNQRELTQSESMLVWSIYYCNTWYKALQGGNPEASQGLSQCKPSCPLPAAVPRPDQTLFDKKGEPDSRVIHYYVWNCWVYLITLQLLRDQSMSKLIVYSSTGGDKLDRTLPQDLLSMQETLKEFHTNLPKEWQSPNLDIDNNNNKQEACCSSTDNFNVDIKSFGNYCINLVSLNYSVNQIILFQPFIPMDRLPTTPISIQSLETSLNAANNISQLFELMVQQTEECHVPLVGFLFANIVYKKLLSYTSDEHYHETGKNGLLRSIDISKNSINYTYDFEMARTLVSVMEQHVQYTIMQRSSFLSSTDSSADSSPSPSIPSPPNYTPLGQNLKAW